MKSTTPRFQLQPNRTRPGRFLVVFPVLVGMHLAVLSVTQAREQPTAEQPAAEQPAGIVNRESGKPAAGPVEKIDELIARGWSEYQLKPSPREDDGKWARRVYLDLLGRIPSVSELETFLADDEDTRRQALVERLLYDDRYTLDYARNWTTIWTNILIGRTGGTANNSFISRDGMQKYLRDSFARNKPYNVLAHELITATGTTTPGKENFNGAVNFLIDKVNDENATLATSSVSRIFMGLQVQCTQCHNHPFNEWKQEKYWEFNAFFRQTRSLRRFVDGTNDVDHAELVDQDYAGESRNPDQADLFYELRNGLLKVAYPVFVDGTPIERSGYVSEVNRRQELSQLMQESPYLDKAIVNRMWGHFFGYGFTKPLDDLGPHNIASHPELFEYLSGEFRNNGYDLKKLISWIVLSEPYQLSSRSISENETDDPLLGQPPRFTHYYIRPMTAEELYESLLVATRADDSSTDYQMTEQMKSRWLQQFTRAFGTDEGDETIEFAGTIGQVLMMFNGDLIRSATRADGGGFLQAVISSNQTPKQKIDRLFQAAFARRPTRKEASTFLQVIQTADNPVEGVEDVWWALLNSNEFLFNH